MPARQPMLESGERPRAVGIQLAMRPVVETQDIAPAGSGSCGAISAASLRMVGDGLHARNQPCRWFLLPITRKQRPHDRAVAKFARRRNDPRISHSKRRAKPLWGRSNRTSDGVVAKAQFHTHLRWIQPQKIRMQFRVIANLVAARDGFLN